MATQPDGQGAPTRRSSLGSSDPSLTNDPSFTSAASECSAQSAISRRSSAPILKRRSVSIYPEPGPSLARTGSWAEAISRRLTRTFTVGSRRPTVSAEKFVALANAVAIKRSEEGEEKRPCYLLHPEARGMAYWDVVTSAALLFTALVTPVEVGFLPLSKTAMDPLFCVNRLVDLVFIIDMGVSFFTMFRVEKQQGLMMLAEWEYRLPMIALRYLKGWFAVDLLSILPLVFDIIPIVNNAEDHTDSSGSASSAPRMLRIVRIMRLTKLARLVRSSRIVKRFQVRLPWPTHIVSMATLLFQVLVISHWIACGLSLQTTFGDPLSSWWGTFGYCQFPSATVEGQITCVDSSEKYLSALYWSLGIVLDFTSKPEKGPHEPIHLNDLRDLTVSETVIFLMLKFCGAIIWTYVTASFVDVIANHDPDATISRQRLLALNRYCAFYKLPPRTCKKLRAYYLERTRMRLALTRQSVAEGFSPKLQEEVAWVVNEKWLRNISFLNAPLRPLQPTDMHQRMLVNVALAMEPMVFTPKETPPPGRLYVIYQGVALYRGSILMDWDHWGDADVMLRSEITRRHHARATTYLHVHFIGPDTIEKIAEEFPVFHRRMRMWVLRRAVIEHVIDGARVYRAKARATYQRWVKRCPTLKVSVRMFMLRQLVRARASRQLSVAHEEHAGPHADAAARSSGRCQRPTMGSSCRIRCVKLLRP